MRQCICQICTCGRHRCEHTSKRRVPFAKDYDDANKCCEDANKCCDDTNKCCVHRQQQITEHKDRYRHFGCQTRDAPIKPASGADWKGTEPPVKLSTTKRDYVPLPIEKRALMRPKVQREPKGQMSCSTTYKHDYKPKKGDRPSIIKRKEGTKDGTMPGTTPGKMVGETTYGRNFTRKEGTKREPAKAKECTLTQLGQPFKGVTETAQSYQPHPYLKRQTPLPKTGELRPEGDFEGNTTHKTDFTPKYQPPPKPIKKIPKWKPGTEKFEGETTHAHDYKCPPQQQKLELVIPEGSLQTAPGPFEGLSQYKRDFPAHEVTTRSLPKWHPALQKHRSSEDAPMSGRTTYKTDYEAPPEDLPPPTSQRKPIKNNITIPSDPMEKVTTSMRDYQKVCQPILSKSCRPDIHYQKPEGKFSDCTTTRCDYTLKTAEKLEKSRREDNLCVAPGAMEDLSTTMRDFQAMCVDCPAKYLKLCKESLPQYRFEKTEKGHDFFKKLKKPKC